MVAANIMGMAEALRVGSTIADALKALKDSEVAPVVDGEGRLVGQIEARDLLKGLSVLESDGALNLSDGVAGLEGRKVEDLMERAFVHTGPEAEASSVMALMEGKKALSVFVVDDGMRLLGRITPKDMLERIWEYRERKGR
ncbi:MAG: CBS domain-containing protein [Deltaproteobacteria bacterium]|nr:CBS domain-containing protein [Deltaproteobacteria bacterium]